MKTLQITMFAATLAATGLPALSQDMPNATQAAQANVCRNLLGYDEAAVDMVVVAPKGPADIGLTRLAGPTDGPVQIRAFDMGTCQPVAVKVWVQDQLGEIVEVQDSDMASFPAARFAEGVSYIRAERALERDLGFVVSGAL
ncbi:MAG: hypothetical protein LPK12_16485 [Rhodobacterales bacterium]|nr:hypothetical protein [Rhodobacterales bacterium]MDX5501540.1 hypothetical protein [Rhodobacterales bacterium]